LHLFCFKNFAVNYKSYIILFIFSELKRQLKAQKKADDKAQKATTVQPTQPSAKKEGAAADGENDDQEIDPNVNRFFIFKKNN